MRSTLGKVSNFLECVTRTNVSDAYKPSLESYRTLHWAGCIKACVVNTILSKSTQQRRLSYLH